MGGSNHAEMVDTYFSISVSALLKMRIQTKLKGVFYIKYGLKGWTYIFLYFRFRFAERAVPNITERRILYKYGRIQPC